MKVGDVVRLKAGGPRMTVTGVDEVEEGAPATVDTTWFDCVLPATADNMQAWSGPNEGNFPVDALETA